MSADCSTVIWSTGCEEARVARVQAIENLFLLQGIELDQYIGYWFGREPELSLDDALAAAGSHLVANPDEGVLLVESDEDGQLAAFEWLWREGVWHQIDFD